MPIKIKRKMLKENVIFVMKMDENIAKIVKIVKIVKNLLKKLIEISADVLKYI
jgi:hypothetical protein